MIDLTLERPIHLAVLEIEGLRVDRSTGAYEALCACAETYRAGGASSPGCVGGVEHARALFHALGVDPTKRRPSSEALLNRALKGKDMPRINNLVDAGNWCSLDFLLPLGLYDRAAIEGPVVLRQGRSGESYEAIGEREMHLEGRYLLADARGPFGSPITDSRRTAVTEATASAAVFIYVPFTYPPARLAEHAALMAERIIAHCGGRLVHSRIASGGGGRTLAGTGG